MHVHPFFCVRPTSELCERVAALPYDVVTSEEARAEVEREPLSFLSIDCAEVHFEPGHDQHAADVYDAAQAAYLARRVDGTFVQDEQPTLSVYRLQWNGRTQIGVVACCEVDDYLNSVIKRHERVFEDKLADRKAHIKALGAQTGPIFLTYRDNPTIDSLVEAAMASEPYCDFTDKQGVRQTVWCVTDGADALAETFAGVPSAYIADGHHRSAAAISVAQDLRAEHPEAGADAEWNRFLAVLFPASQLSVFPYDLGKQGIYEESDDVSVERIMQVSDEGGIMPQKSTWFEPKLRSGLFFHEIDSR